MPTIARVPFGRFGSILIETGSSNDGFEDTSRARLEDRFRSAYSQLCDTVATLNDSLLDAVRSAREGASPSTVKAEFGLQLSTEGSFVVVGVSTQANFRLTFEWDLTEVRDRP